MPGSKRTSQYYGTSKMPFRILARVVCILQWISGLAVFLMSVRFLTTYDYPFPKTFYGLVAVAGLTLLVIPFSCITSWRQKMTPRTSLAINLGLAALWTIAFAIAASRLIQVVIKDCPSAPLFKIGVGVHVCRTFTIIFIGAICGIATSVAAFACDIFASRRQVLRGEYKYTPTYMSGTEVTSYESRQPLYRQEDIK